MKKYIVKTLIIASFAFIAFFGATKNADAFSISLGFGGGYNAYDSSYINNGYNNYGYGYNSYNSYPYGYTNNNYGYGNYYNPYQAPVYGYGNTFGSGIQNPYGGIPVYSYNNYYAQPTYGTYTNNNMYSYWYGY